MNLGKWIFLFTFLASVQASGQSAKPIVGWRYIPAQTELWTEFTNNMNAAAFKLAFENSIEMRDLAKDPSEIHEADLAKAKSLRALGYPQAALLIFTDILNSAPNSFAANEALVELNTLVQESSALDEETLSKAINRAVPSELPESAASMVGFYISLDHLQAKQTKWMKEHVKSVKSDSYWQHRLLYLNALELVNEKKVDQALAKFEEITKIEGVNQRLKDYSRIQIARLYFEKTDYPAAEKLYSEIKVANRNSGRLLYERAWNQYYLRDYSLALGMLESLKAPYFTTAVEPEQYVLSSLVLRDLCHYPEVKKINSQFFEVFEPVMKHIRAGKPLSQNPTLLAMALVREPFRTSADVVDLVQKERSRITTELGNSAAVKVLVDRYTKVEQEIKGRLERRLAGPLRDEAERLLAVADQMKLLDYVSGLDENRIQGLFESRGYQAEKPDNVRFNTLYWPLRKPAQAPLVAGTEYWFEELTTLRVLISDRCKGGM